MPYYCGERGLREKTYVQDMEVNIAAEILEKLCQYEEIEEKYDRIIDELVGENN